MVREPPVALLDRDTVELDGIVMYRCSDDVVFDINELGGVCAIIARYRFLGYHPDMASMSINSMATTAHQQQ